MNRTYKVIWHKKKVMGSVLLVALMLTGGELLGNSISYAEGSGGASNTASGTNASVSGGEQNTASGKGSSVSGGEWNKASGEGSSVSGGKSNTASGDNSSVSGGIRNESSGDGSSVLGGFRNTASGKNSSILGGWDNLASGDESSISGGWDNKARGEWSSISGGLENTASGRGSSVSGGNLNESRGAYSSILGGSENKTSGNYSSVSGGYWNTATGDQSSVSGGEGNTANGKYSSVSGGHHNKAIGDYSSVSGGNSSMALGEESWAAGGAMAYGTRSNAIGNGAVNTYKGNEDTAEKSIAIGYQATADTAGTISFGHDAGDVSGYTVTWQQKASEKDGKYYDADNKEITEDQYYDLANPDSTWNDYTKKPTVTSQTYSSASYNRLVKVADGVDDHDVVVMEQLRKAMDDVSTKDTRNTVKAGENVTLDTKDNADGSHEYTVNVKADGKVAASDTKLVSGDTVYNETRVQKDGNYIKQANTAGENLTALDNQVANNAQNIYHMDNRISNLDNRVNKVGAGAAALAALHPLDFDPADKWDFAVGYGNYRNANSVAFGAFYRPNEDTMFSIGTNFGNGENMFNAGLSFKIGQGSGVTTSRTAMAKKIESLENTLDEQNKKIAELEALIQQYIGKK